jgi:hypothetical protein
MGNTGVCTAGGNKNGKVDRSGTYLLILIIGAYNPCLPFYFRSFSRAPYMVKHLAHRLVMFYWTPILYDAN